MERWVKLEIRRENVRFYLATFFNGIANIKRNFISSKSLFFKILTFYTPQFQNDAIYPNKNERK